MNFKEVESPFMIKTTRKDHEATMKPRTDHERAHIAVTQWIIKHFKPFEITEDDAKKRMLDEIQTPLDHGEMNQVMTRAFDLLFDVATVSLEKEPYFDEIHRDDVTQLMDDAIGTIVKSYTFGFDDLYTLCDLFQQRLMWRLESFEHKGHTIELCKDEETFKTTTKEKPLTYHTTLYDALDHVRFDGTNKPVDPDLV